MGQAHGVQAPAVSATDRWTTLDLVMLAWLRAHDPDCSTPDSRDHLYRDILTHEQRYWAETWRDRKYGPDDPRAVLPSDGELRLMRQAAVAFTLCNAPAEKSEQAAAGVDGLADTTGKINERGIFIAQALEECLRSNGRLAVRPDPVADHLIVTELGAKPGLLASTIGRARAGGDDHALPVLLFTLARAGEASTQARSVTAAALGEVLVTDAELWQPALGVARAVGGTITDALAAALRSDRDVPVDIGSLIAALPDDEFNLNPIAAAAMQRLQTLLADHGRHLDDTARAARATLHNDLSVKLIRVGDRPGALAAIDEAVALRRQLVAANPAAFTPDLATALNNQANLRSQVGDRPGALAAIDEAVALRRQLVAANPAAFTPNLAGALNNQANRRSQVGDRPGALAAIDEAASELGEAPWTVARLQARAGQWALAHDEPDAAIVAAGRALAAASAAPAHDLQAISGRQEIRALVCALVAESLLAEVAVPIPVWAVGELSDDTVDLVNRWRTARSSGQEAAFVIQYAAALTESSTADELAVLASLYEPDPFLNRCLAVVAALVEHGVERVAADIASTEAAEALLDRWLATPTWPASEQFLIQYRDELLTPGVIALLAGSEQPEFRLHYAILALTGCMPVSEVYDIVTSPTDAAMAALDALGHADADRLILTVTANPALLSEPGCGPLTLAVLVLVTGQQAELPDELLTSVAAAPADVRPVMRRRLRALADQRSDLADQLGRLLAALAD